MSQYPIFVAIIEPTFKFIHMKSYRQDSVNSLEQSLKNTGASLFLKAVGRDTKPAWGNRIVKDSYDLEYDIPGDLAKMTEKFIKSPPKRQLKRAKDHLEDLTTSNHGYAATNRRKGKAIDLSSSWHNPQRVEVGRLSGTQGDSLGLCPFQYQKTIQGNIRNRAGNHLSFAKNRGHRSVIENPVYYDRHQDIDFSLKNQLEKKKSIDLQHSFQSYTNRQTFQPKDQLDKIFDIDGGLKIATPRRNPEAIRKFDLVVERKEPKLNESARLSYEFTPATDMIKRKSISFSINEQERATSFYPQVISDRRGCYR